jgi:hypothetical protein
MPKAVCSSTMLPFGTINERKRFATIAIVEKIDTKVNHEFKNLANLALLPPSDLLTAGDGAGIVGNVD